MANVNENTIKKKISQSEQTNAKNLENLRIAAVTIDTLDNYNPSNPLIAKTALAEFETTFARRMQATNEALVVEDAAVEAQTAAFKLVRPKITQIISAVKGQGVSIEAMGHLMTTVRRFRGVRVTKQTPDAAPPPEEGAAKAKHSVSQQSIAGLLEGLDLLDEQIKALPNYKPNEVEFQSASISAWVAGLRELRNTRLAAQAAVTQARQARDEYGYGNEGLMVRMNTLKAYIVTILDKTDARYKKIKGLRFVDTTNK